MASCLVALSFSAHAADDMKADKTGTNPFYFSNDARVNNPYQRLNEAGDGSQNMTSFSDWMPFWVAQVTAPTSDLP